MEQYNLECPMCGGYLPSDGGSCDHCGYSRTLQSEV